MSAVTPRNSTAFTTIDLDRPGKQVGFVMKQGRVYKQGGNGALTVRDLGVSGPWYQALIGAEPALDEHTDTGFRHLVWAFENGTLFGIHQHDREAGAESFTEFRTGLDHVGFGCASRAELQSWVDRLESLGIEHGGIVDAP